MKRLPVAALVLLCLFAVSAESFTISAYRPVPTPETFYHILFQYQNYVEIYDSDNPSMENKTFDMTGYIKDGPFQQGKLTLTDMMFKVEIQTNRYTPIDIRLEISPFTTVTPVNNEYKAIPTAISANNFKTSTVTVTNDGHTYKYTASISVKNENGTTANSFTIAAGTTRVVHIITSITATIDGNTPASIDDWTIRDENNQPSGIKFLDTHLQPSFKMSYNINNYSLDNVEKNIDYISTVVVTITGT